MQHATKFFGFALTGVLGFVLFTTDPGGKELKTVSSNKAMIERGKYLVMVGSCDDCHTTKNFGPKGPEPDISKRISGSPANMKLPSIPKDVLGPDK